MHVAAVRLLPIGRVLLLVVAALSGGIADAEDWRTLFTDPQDGRLDASRWLLSRGGFLPVPMIITEPAIGYGGGVALAFFHRNDEMQRVRTASDSTTRQEFVPPSVSGVMAAATENGTKFGGAGHLGIWRDNTLRFTGGVAAMSVDLTFYGAGDFPRLSDGVDYELEGWGLFSQLAWRWGETDFWLGPQVIYFDADASLQTSNVLPIFDQLNDSIENAGAGIAFSYDGRDNIFTPSRGLQSEWYVRQRWGEFVKHFDYTEVGGKNRYYFEPGRPWVVGLRFDVSYTSGRVPFYALPSINQRGISRSRYQGEAIVDAEIETRYAIDGRWFAVAFAGVGRAADSVSELDTTDGRWAGGVGVRYLVARLLGLQVGIDVARGPEEWAFYIQAGSGWSF